MTLARIRGTISLVSYSASAQRTDVRNASSSSGLAKKAKAPPFNASRRIAGSSRPVIIITLLSGDK
jgi:hypothetical protein